MTSSATSADQAGTDGTDGTGTDGTGVPVLVVDDHELVRASLVVALRTKGIDAHTCPTTGIAEIHAEVRKHRPGVVLLDLDLGRDAHGAPIDGADAIAGCRAAGWAVLVLSGTAMNRREKLAAAVAAGARGVIPKSQPFAVLLRAVRQTVAGRPVMTEQERRSWLELDSRSRTEAHRRAALLARLSHRERVVLERLVEGHRAVEIADEFVVSVSTVRSQIRSILAKLEVSSQLGAVALAGARYDMQP